MIKRVLASAAFGAALTLSACGGGGGAPAPIATTPPGGTPPPSFKQYRVAGPLDAVQAPLSDQVFGQLAMATDGTPLKPVLICANDLVTFDTLDIADTLANALQGAAASSGSPQAALAATAADLNSSVNQIALDLQGLLNALAARGGGCGANGQPSGVLAGTNPLGGTLLAPLGTQLEQQLQSIQLANLGGTGGATLSLPQLATLMGQLSAAFDAGVAAVTVPPFVPGLPATPMVGGTVKSVQKMLADLTQLLTAVSQLSVGAVRTSLQVALYDAINNGLTQIVPLKLIEQQAGVTGTGVFTTPIAAGATTISNLFANNIGTVYTTAALKTALTNVTTPVVDPIATQVLPVLSNDLLVSLAHLAPVTVPTTGTPLDASLDAVKLLLGPVGGVGQPVQTLLTQIVGAVKTGAGGVAICPSTNPLLSILCGL